MYPSCVACLQSNYVLGTAELGKSILSCLSQGNLFQLLGALKKHGKGAEKEDGES